jgi:hypothetical protein
MTPATYSVVTSNSGSVGTQPHRFDNDGCFGGHCEGRQRFVHIETDAADLRGKPSRDISVDSGDQSKSIAQIFQEGRSN